MSCEFGSRLRIHVFGESHGRFVGVVLDGLPAGERIDAAELQGFLDRRRPGRDELSSARREADVPELISGIRDGVTTGGPLCAVVENTDARPGDYEAYRTKPRPGHADYTAWAKWGENADMRGGGRFSGRLTAPLCVAGGIAKQLLARRGIHVGAHLAEVGGEPDEPFPLRPAEELFACVAAKPWPTVSDGAGERMRTLVAEAARAGDSLGGIVECAAIGLPAGLGGPLFEGAESRLSAALFAVPAVKGVEFGAGFDAARMRGSAHNDPFAFDAAGDVVTLKNDCGGLLGGITDGMPLVLRAALKPTPSIALPQRTVDLATRTPARITVTGRHDPCVALRAVPAVEAVTAAVLLDMLLEGI